MQLHRPKPQGVHTLGHGTTQLVRVFKPQNAPNKVLDGLAPDMHMAVNLAVKVRQNNSVNRLGDSPALGKL
jgi:hypothetical protein